MTTITTAAILCVVVDDVLLDQYQNDLLFLLACRSSCSGCLLVALVLLLGHGGHVLISSYAKRNPGLRIVGEKCYTLLYCCLYLCFVLFVLLSLAYSRHCYHVVWLYCFFHCCCCSCCCYCCWSCAIIVFFFVVVRRWLLLPYSPSGCYHGVLLFHVVSRCFALFCVVVVVVSCCSCPCGCCLLCLAGQKNVISTARSDSLLGGSLRSTSTQWKAINWI